MSDTQKIKIGKDGPYMVEGNIPLARQSIGVNEAGESVDWVETGTIGTKAKYALCRCGQSANKPFCDGSHADEGFDGTELASRRPYAEKAKVLDGPRFRLMDQEDLCAVARFCDTHKTVWEEVENTDDPERAAIFLDQVKNCVSGRLVAIDTATGEPVHPLREPRISVTQDPAEACSGPLWVEGGIEIEGSDGVAYERRNRVALCRCGASGNKPFCDGTHIQIGFSDEE